MRVRVTYNIDGGIPENQPPVITDIPAQSNNEEDIISLQVNATDPNGNNLSYSATGLPAGLSINPSTGLISGTITIGAETSSPYTVTVTVQDDGSPVKSTDEIFSWGVSAVAVNQPPVITPISNQSNTEEDVVSLQVNATDPENDNLTYSASILPTGLSINSSTGLISGTISAGSEASSPYITTITVTDDGSPAESSNEVFTWNVSAVNQSPILSPIGNQTNDESDVVSLQVNATDPDLNTITYSATGLPTGLSINSSTGLISGTIDASANTGSPYITTVTVADDGVPSESDSEVLTWTVNEVIAVEANNKYYGAGDALINTFSGDVPAFNSGDPNVIQGSTSLTRIELGTSCSSIGAYAFGVCTNLNGPTIIGDGVVNSVTTINDAAFFDCSSLIGPVVIGNSVTNIGSYVFGGASSSHPIEELYVDVGSSIWGSNSFYANSGGLGSSPNLIIYVSPTYFGIGTNYNNTWKNNNYVNGSAQIVNWDNYPVATPNAANQPPVLSLIGNQTNDESDVVSLQVSATDPDSNNLSYSATGLPTGLSINSTTGLISGTISVGAEASSPYTTTVTVTDDGSPIESTNEVFTWNVSAVVALTDTIIYDSGDNVLDSIPGDIPANWDRFSPFPATRLEIGTSCTSIGSYAFYQKTGYLSSLDIPSSVVTIGNKVFYGCTGFTAVYTNTPATSWTGANALQNTTFTTIYTGPNATGYTSSFQGRTGLTIANWDNYPVATPN
jgi:hypothetical protein